MDTIDIDKDGLRHRRADNLPLSVRIKSLKSMTVPIFVGGAFDFESRDYTHSRSRQKMIVVSP